MLVHLACTPASSPTPAEDTPDAGTDTDTDDADATVLHTVGDAPFLGMAMARTTEDRVVAMSWVGDTADADLYDTLTEGAETSTATASSTCTPARPATRT